MATRDPDLPQAPDTPWWEGPPPPGYTGQWPPPLPPGASYGPDFGQVVYGANPPTVNPNAPVPNNPWPTVPTDNLPPEQPRQTPGPGPSPDPTIVTGPRVDDPMAPQPPTASPPTFTPPNYTPPPPAVAPPPFSWESFVDPDPNELLNDPTYKFTLKQEQDRIERSAAARGVLNTGGTINDLMTNAADIASTGYHDLWNRKRSDYDTNRANAFQNYTTNYGIGKDVQDFNYASQYLDPFKMTYQGNLDTFNAQQHNFDQSQYYGQRNTELGKQYDWYARLFDYQKQSDDWEHKFKVLGLL
jgi:hypothetical protein